MFQGKKALLVCEEDATIASLEARPSAVENGGQSNQLLERAATYAWSNDKGCNRDDRRNPPWINPGATTLSYMKEIGGQQPQPKNDSCRIQAAYW